MVIHSGEWPFKTFPLIVFNDLIWWLPFVLYLLGETWAGQRLRRVAPWACAVMNALAAVSMLLFLRGGTEIIPSFGERTAYISEHMTLWRIGWGTWMLAGLSLVAFYAWWGSWIPSSRMALAALMLAIFGLASDWFAEALFIGWLPARIEVLASLGTFLSGAGRTFSTRSLGSY
jgi:hypothetical protein